MHSTERQKLVIFLFTCLSVENIILENVSVISKLNARNPKALKENEAVNIMTKYHQTYCSVDELDFNFSPFMRKEEEIERGIEIVRARVHG